MQLTAIIKLYPTKEQRALLTVTMDTYISTVNSLVSDAMQGISIAKYTSKDVTANLPSAMKNQCIRDAKSIIAKHYKFCHSAILKNRNLAKRGKSIRVTAPVVPVLKKPCCYINNQNFAISKDVFSPDNTVYLAIPVLVDGKTKRIRIKTACTERQLEQLATAKLGTLRIVMKGYNIVAQAVYEVSEPEHISEGAVMGVDLGIKCPAVSYCSDGSVKFYGNGRKNKYMRRHYAYLRKKLQSSKHPEAVKRINDKEQRIMKDIDHKISHDIIETAVAHKVSVIKLEQLANIRSTARTSRKNNHSLHTWSFYRLAMYIEYKAKLAGIRVLYVNPKYTSQKCPVCGSLNHADDRVYRCKCGCHTHRDIVGAMNICASTEYVGDSTIRHTA